MEETQLPLGVQDYPSDGWPLAAPLQEWVPIPVEFNGAWVPRTFHTVISKETADNPHDPEWVLTLMYLVDNDEILLAMASAAGGELPDILDRVRSLRPLRWWQRRALKHVVTEEALRAVGLMDAAAGRDASVAHGSPSGPLLEGGRDWLTPHTGDRDERAAQWASAQMAAADNLPLGRRRRRMTREHLEEVARVYRQAHADGQHPTAAVAEAFHVAHSTAADWVLKARRTKPPVLGPADSTRGGEKA